MPQTYLEQDTQIRATRAGEFVGNAASGSTMESGAVSILNDLNNLRSQVHRVLSNVGGNWYDDLPSFTNLDSELKQRSISTLNSELDALEVKRLLCRVEILTDITVSAAAAAVGTIVAIAPASITDGQTFTLDDGVNAPTVFEFDKVPDGVTPGNVVVDISAAGSDIAVATAMVSAINGVGAGLALTADNAGGTVATVTITNDQQGSVGNVTTWSTTTTMVITQPTGGAGDVHILSVSGSEAPTQVIAFGATTRGAVSAQSALSGAGFAKAELTEIAGPNAIAPKNLVILRDASTGQVLAASDGRDIFGLLQVESTATDGVAFDDTSSGNRGKLSFVVVNAGRTDLELVDASEIGGKTINYAYVRRDRFEDVPEDCFLPFSGFTDQSTSVDVKRQTAYDNQSTTPVELGNNATLDIGTGLLWRIRDVLNADLLTITEGSTGGNTTLAIGSDVDTFDVDAVVNDFAQGVRLDTSGQRIDIGVNDGVIESTGANDLRIIGAGEMYLDDGNQTGSTWVQTTGIKLSDTTTEWDTFKTNFGEVSLLYAINEAYAASAAPDRYEAVTNTAILANNDVSGPSGASNLDADLGDYSAKNFVSEVWVFQNGNLRRNGADASANNDVYPGTSPAIGELRFEYNLRTGERITMIIF